MGYHAFENEDGEEFGSFEVFHSSEYHLETDDGGSYEPGWYWWSCFPGCLPDGEATGPFKNEAEAIADANA